MTEQETSNAPSHDAVQPGRGELPLSGFQQHIETGIRQLKGRTKFAGINAVHGLRRAWLIAPIDPEMAAFRAVTAEEEAASALISAVKTRRYPGASRQNAWSHPHKAGIMILVETLGRIIGESGFPQPALHITDVETKPRIDVVIPGIALGIPGHSVTPDNPLSFSLGQSGSAEGASERMLFADQFAALATETGAKDIRDHFVRAANLRNQLLYASDQGRAFVTEPDPFILNRRSRVFTLLALTLIIMQTTDHQLFAQQALEGFLTALQQVTTDSFDYSAADVEQDLRFEVIKVHGEDPVMTIRKRTVE